MGVSTCIQDNSVYIKTGLLNLVYQLSLDVRLEIVYLYISILLTKFDKVVSLANFSVIMPAGVWAFILHFRVTSLDFIYYLGKQCRTSLTGNAALIAVTICFCAASFRLLLHQFISTGIASASFVHFP